MTNLGQVKDYLNDADDEEVKQAPSDDEEDEHSALRSSALSSTSCLPHSPLRPSSPQEQVHAG